jgi:phosphohistidine phosphatase
MSNRQLVIVRHGKSDWGSPELEDIDRPLKPRGLKDANRMAKKLQKKGFTPDLIVSSPATRARSTAMIFAQELGYDPKKIKVMEELYHANANALVNIARHLPSEYFRVMLFGHNPGFMDFVNIYYPKKIDNLPTCGVVILTFDKGSWMDMHPSALLSGSIDYPKNEE